MKKFLLSLTALLTMTTTALATDTYRLVKSIDEITDDGRYILYGCAKSSVQVPGIMTADCNGKDYMDVYILPAEAGDEINVDDANSNNYGILKIESYDPSHSDYNATHYTLYVTNPGSGTFDGSENIVGPGYLSDMKTGNTLSKYSEVDGDHEAEYHVTITIDNSTGDATIVFVEGDNRNIRYNATSKSAARICCYGNTTTGKLPRLYKLVQDDREEIVVTSPITKDLVVDLGSDPLTIFSIDNEDVNEKMQAAINITTLEGVSEDSYSISRENGEIKVVFNSPGDYTFKATISADNADYRLIPVQTCLINVVDPNVAPERPIIYPEGGDLYLGDYITIEGDGTIYYTFEEISLNADNGTKYDEPVSVSTLGEVTLRAIAVSSKGVQSEIASATYNVKDFPDAYRLLTDISQLGDESEIVVVGYNSSSKSYEALSTTQNKNNRSQAGVSPKNDIISFANIDEAVAVINVKKVGDQYTLFVTNGESQGYLYAPDFGQNYLRTQDQIDEKNSLANINIEDNTTTISYTNGTKTRYLKYNKSNKLFSLYESGQDNIQIYYHPIGTVVDEVPVPEIEGNFTVDGDCISGGSSVKIAFKALDGHHVYYKLDSKDNKASKMNAATRAACTDEHEGYTKHEGEEVELNGSHSALSFFSCNPATGAHSAVKTYTLSLQTGVAEIEIAEGVAEYYGIDGQRVEAGKLLPGVYVRIKNGKTSKVLVK